METSFSSIDRDLWSFSSDDPIYIRMLLALKQRKPDEVNIIAMPQTNDGCIYAFLPRKYVAIKVPRELSQRQRQECAERLRNWRESTSDSRSDE